MSKRILTGLIIGLFVFCIAETTNAAITFPETFEDGNADGWLVGSATGTGSTGVELHNESQMAFAKQTGNGTHSLSIDFSYEADATLSFDMHAIASPSTNTQANSGVVVSFLNAFNTSLGYMRLINNTSGSYGTYDIAVDGQQHNFSALLSDWALQAGLGASDPISKVSLSYFATAQSYNGYSQTGYPHLYQSSASVWFDNVNATVNPIPAPGALILGSLGAGLVGWLRKRKSLI